MRVRIAASAAPRVMAGKIKMRDAAAAGNRQPAENHRKNENQHGAEREIRHRESEEREDADGVVRRACRGAARQAFRGNSDRGADEKRNDGEFERGGIVRQHHAQ